MNNITVLGNLTNTPKKTKSIIHFGIADNLQRGEQRRTTYYNAVLFNAERLDWVLKFRKGDQVLATGEIYTEEYNGKTQLRLVVNRLTRVTSRNPSEEGADGEEIPAPAGDIPGDDLPVRGDDLPF